MTETNSDTAIATRHVTAKRRNTTKKLPRTQWTSDELLLGARVQDYIRKSRIDKLVREAVALYKMDADCVESADNTPVLIVRHSAGDVTFMPFNREHDAFVQSITMREIHANVTGETELQVNSPADESVMIGISNKDIATEAHEPMHIVVCDATLSSVVTSKGHRIAAVGAAILNEHGVIVDSTSAIVEHFNSNRVHLLEFKALCLALELAHRHSISKVILANDNLHAVERMSKYLLGPTSGVPLTIRDAVVSMQHVGVRKSTKAEAGIAHNVVQEAIRQYRMEAAKLEKAVRNLKSDAGKGS